MMIQPVETLKVRTILFAGTLIGLSWVLVGRANGAGLIRFESSDFFMGATATITAWASPGAAVEPVLAACRAELRRLDQVFSPYRQGSAVNELNQFAGTRPVRVSSEVVTRLQWSRGIAEITRGAWDITTAAYAWEYGFGQGDYRVPPPARLDYLKTFVGYKNVVIYQQDRTVVYKRDGVQIDLDGLMINDALDRVLDILDAARLPAARVSLGQGLAVLGSNPAGGPWLESLPDPRDPRQALATVPLGAGKLVWARATDRSFLQAGTRYYPILDPETGQPARYSLGAYLWLPRHPTVNLPATALMLMPAPAVLELVKSVPGAQACVINLDGSVVWSPGWEKDARLAR